MKRLLILTFIIVGCLSYNIDMDQLSASGISSGAFMSNQLSIAHSNHFVGSMQVAGGPFLCSQGSVLKALASCMSTPSTLKIKDLYEPAQKLEKDNKIDSLENLKHQKVFLFSGKLDTVVKQDVVKKNKQWYDNFGVDLKVNFDIDSEHAWITTNYTKACSHLGIPYMNECQYDLAYQGLSHIFPDLKLATEQNPMNVIQFSQKPYQTVQNLLDNVGYLYIPKPCQNGEKCKLHIAFSGCEMTLEDIGQDFVRHSQLNELAEANNIIILYPQIVKSLYYPSNPKGCWDWWGYSDIDPLNLKYATKEGEQISAIWKIIEDLSKGQLTYE